MPLSGPMRGQQPQAFHLCYPSAELRSKPLFPPFQPLSLRDLWVLAVPDGLAIHAVPNDEKTVEALLIERVNYARPHYSDC